MATALDQNVDFTVIVPATYLPTSAPDGTTVGFSSPVDLVRLGFDFLGAVTSCAIDLWIKNQALGTWGRVATYSIFDVTPGVMNYRDIVIGAGYEFYIQVTQINPGTSGNTVRVSADAARFSAASQGFGPQRVSSTPGEYSPTVGIINATAQSIVCDVSRASNVLIGLSGTFVGLNVTFEASIDGGANWFAIQVARSNSATVEGVSGAVSSPLTYAWEASVNAYTHVRARSTAITSGAAVVRFLPGAYATEPIPTVLVAPNQTLATVSSAGTPAGTAHNVVTAATTNTASLVAAACSLFEMTASNLTASTIYIKLYNKASAPTLASDVPVLVVPVAAGAVLNMEFGRIGKRFSTGLAIAVTGAAANTDTTATAAGALINLTRV